MLLNLKKYNIMSVSSIIARFEAINNAKAQNEEKKALVLWAKRTLIAGDEVIEYKELGEFPYYSFCPIKRGLINMGTYKKYSKYPSLKAGYPCPKPLSWVVPTCIEDFLELAHYANGSESFIIDNGGSIPSEYYTLKNDGCPTAPLKLKGIFKSLVKEMGSTAILTLLGYSLKHKQ